MRNALAAVALVALVSLAPTQVGSRDLTDADNAYRIQDYDAAAEGYRKVVRNNPKDGRSWFRLAYSEHVRERFPQAITAYRRALEVKHSIILTKYNLACAYARNGDTELALDALEEAITNGYTLHDQIQVDPDLASISQTPRFDSLVRRARAPVMYYSEGRKMAGLAGTWRTSDGGVLTANVTSKGHSVRVDLVTAGRQEAFLLLYFSAPDRWAVSGGTSDGGTFAGPVTFDGRDIVCTGKRALEGALEETRIRISLEPDRQGRIVREVRGGDGWSVEKSIDLAPSN
jgi:tetratricopeptide (TPR) repeat protein